MAEKTPVSQAEWPIMESLWEKGTATASELVEAVTAGKDISMRTVKTHIRRLVDKGAVGYAIDPDDSRVYHYRPLVTRGEAVQTRKRSILGDLFGGDPAALLDHFVEDKSLGEDEFKKIQQLLRRKRKGGD